MQAATKMAPSRMEIPKDERGQVVVIRSPASNLYDRPRPRKRFCNGAAAPAVAGFIAPLGGRAPGDPVRDKMSSRSRARDGVAHDRGTSRVRVWLPTLRPPP